MIIITFIINITEDAVSVGPAAGSKLLLPAADASLKVVVAVLTLAGPPTLAFCLRVRPVAGAWGDRSPVNELSRGGNVCWFRGVCLFFL